MAELQDAISEYAKSKGVTREQAISDLEGINKGFNSLYETGTFSLDDRDEKKAHQGLSASFKKDPTLLRAFDAFRKARGMDGVKDTLLSANNTLFVGDSLRGLADYAFGTNAEDDYKSEMLESFGFNKQADGDFAPPYQKDMATKADVEAISDIQDKADTDQPQTQTQAQQQSTQSGDIEIKRKPVSMDNPARVDDPRDPRGPLNLARGFGSIDPRDKSIMGRVTRNTQAMAANEGRNRLKAQYERARLARLAQDRMDERENNIASKWENSDTGRNSGLRWNELDPTTQAQMRQRMNNYFGEARKRPEFTGEASTKEASGLLGGAQAVPRPDLEELTAGGPIQVPATPEMGQGVFNQVTALQRALKNDPNNQEIKNALASFENAQFGDPKPKPEPKNFDEYFNNPNVPDAGNINKPKDYSQFFDNPNVPDAGNINKPKDYSQYFDNPEVPDAGNINKPKDYSQYFDNPNVPDAGDINKFSQYFNNPNVPDAGDINKFSQYFNNPNVPDAGDINKFSQYFNNPDVPDVGNIAPQRDSRYQLPAYSQQVPPAPAPERDSRYQLPAYSQQVPPKAPSDPLKPTDRDSRYQLPSYTPPAPQTDLPPSDPFGTPAPLPKDPKKGKAIPRYGRDGLIGYDIDGVFRPTGGEDAMSLQRYDAKQKQDEEMFGNSKNPFTYYQPGVGEYKYDRRKIENDPEALQDDINRKFMNKDLAKGNYGAADLQGFLMRRNTPESRGILSKYQQKPVMKRREMDEIYRQRKRDLNPFS